MKDLSLLVLLFFTFLVLQLDAKAGQLQLTDGTIPTSSCEHTPWVNHQDLELSNHHLELIRRIEASQVELFMANTQLKILFTPFTTIHELHLMYPFFSGNIDAMEYAIS